MYTNFVLLISAMSACMCIGDRTYTLCKESHVNSIVSLANQNNLTGTFYCRYKCANNKAEMNTSAIIAYINLFSPHLNTRTHIHDGNLKMEVDFY